MTTTLPDHLFVSSSDGALYDTRNPNWHKLPPVRPNYRGAHRDIKTTADLKACLRQGYAWPGGYELVFLTDDGALLCADCVRKEWRSVSDAVRNKLRDGWRVVACGYEAVSAECARETSEDLVSHCDHCNKEFGEIC